MALTMDIKNRVSTDETIKHPTHQEREAGHDAWLVEQIKSAYQKHGSGDAVYFNHEEAKSRMVKCKAQTRLRSLTA